MSTPEPTPIEAKVEYEESGRVHRYFLNWRHAAFAGYFAILYGFASTAEKIWKEAPGVLPWLLLGAGFVGIGFLFIDLRTRELYYAAIEAGKAIESGEKGTLYARLQVKPVGGQMNGRGRTAQRYGRSTCSSRLRCSRAPRPPGRDFVPDRWQCSDVYASSSLPR